MIIDLNLLVSPHNSLVTTRHVAQLEELSAHNRSVVGSCPTVSTKEKNKKSELVQLERGSKQ